MAGGVKPLNYVAGNHATLLRGRGARAGMIAIDMGRTLDDFEAARKLIAVMGVWDLAETRAQGCSGADLIELYYSDTAETLMRKFSANGVLLLARWAGEPAACIAFQHVGDATAEIRHMFVRPEFRGRGFARMLMVALLERMQDAGLAKARLETVTFMTQAIALYHSLGFRPCPPFYAPSQDLAAITIFMERSV